NERIARNEFVEWQEVYHGNFYGTLILEMEKLWEQGKIVLFDVDVQGAINLKKKFPAQTLTVFIKPPSAQILFERLHSRGTDPADKIEERISKAKHELELEEKFDHVIVNDNLRKALLESEEIVNQFISA
ncbi:MAG: guanylate kinase, partial [Chitinophagales bacterium]|nr:guanylate kinase [Chitinophagales bacterium]